MATTFLGSGFWFFWGFAHSRQRSAHSRQRYARIRQKSAHRKKHGTLHTEIQLLINNL